MGAGGPDEQVGGDLRVGHGVQDLGDLGLIEFVGQSVAAEDEPVPPGRLDPPQVDGHVVGHAQGAGQDVPVRMHGGLGLAELAAAHHLLGQAVVDGDLRQLSVVVAVGARVAHVDEGDDVAVVLVDQGGGGEGGAHATQLGVVEAVLEHHPVGLGDGLGQPRPGGLGAEGAGQGVDGQAGRHLPAGVAPHAVGHGEQCPRLDREVLVDRSDQSGVGCRSRTEQRHVSAPPRTRCRRPGGDPPSAACSARRCGRC